MNQSTYAESNHHEGAKAPHSDVPHGDASREKHGGERPNTFESASNEAGNDSGDSLEQPIGQHASFIDTFASFEDYARFQTVRLRSVQKLIKAEFALAKKALLVSFMLAIVVALLAFSVWMVINISIYWMATHLGAMMPVALAILGALNLCLLWFVASELKKALANVSLGKCLDMLNVKYDNSEVSK
ncbi:hypothetical protein ACFO4O_07540 [Glaciecola siphonariae]|uniref:Phage holin family protein n=1 Tax=Glaciecola siphonariae TaxID=521012 RepID=A0ABV9LU09_9ALTE